jgi:hypothetical protein
MTLPKLARTALLSTVFALIAAAPARAAEPVTERPRAFVNVMLSGAMVHEDPDNRLTHRRRSAFAVPGIALRAGGVVGRHHLIGGLFQGNWRSTRMALDRAEGDREWGAISSWSIGPEYRYQTSFGLYAGGSLSFAYTFADDDVGGGGSPDCNLYRCLEEHLQESDDQGIPGVGARAVLGYEVRLRRTLAVNGEAFVGVLHGDDEHDVAMTLPTYGLAVGVGF